MKSHLFKIALISILSVFVVGVCVFTLLEKKDEISYGVSFSEYRSNEMGLNAKEVFDFGIEEMGFKKMRLSTHWHIVEKTKGVYDFSALDYELRRLEEVGGTAIVTVGRRQPGWPECHDPEWAKNIPVEERNKALLDFIEKVVSRYKDSKIISHWQVENEPFLTGFSREACGDFSLQFLQTEIDLVRRLDPDTKILVTDSGELSTWSSAYSAGDAFGTSVYVYIWNPVIGKITYPLPSSFFIMKKKIIELLHGKKETLLVELSLEPWLLVPIKDASFETQFDRMDIAKIKSIINFAQNTGFDEQYLWGLEWWYYLKQNGYPEIAEYITSRIGQGKNM